MTPDPAIDGWYRADGSRASFAFEVREGEVVTVAPYGRKMIMGLQWGTTYMVLEQGGFTIARMREEMQAPEMQERAMRFGYLLSEIEVGARRLLDGAEDDMLLALIKMQMHLDEAKRIADEVSREALDKVVPKMETSGRATIRLKHPPPEDETIEDVLPE